MPAFAGIAEAHTLEGVFDVHAHAHPDTTARSIDVFELAKIYRDQGFRGFVIMNHHDPTAGLAYLVRIRPFQLCGYCFDNIAPDNGMALL